MPNPLDDAISTLNAEVTREKTVTDSAIALINGIQTRIDAAVAAALAAGATQAQLKAITDLSAGLKTEDDNLAAAVQANTPVVVTPPSGP